MRKHQALKFKRIIPEFKEQPGHFHGPNRPPETTDRGLLNQTSKAWSGSVLFIDPDKDPFAWIYGEWTVPNAYSPDPNSGKPYYSSAWIGIDGDGSPDVLQGGTETDVTGSQAAFSYAWWEWYPAYECKLAIFPSRQVMPPAC